MLAKRTVAIECTSVQIADSTILEIKMAVAVEIIT